MKPRQIVVVGSGFSALAVARALDLRLDRCAPDSVIVTLITPCPSAELSPLVPAVISGALAPWQACVPLRPWLRHVKLLHAELTRVHVDTKRLSLQGPEQSSEKRELDYDDLVLALEPACSSSADSTRFACPIDTAQAGELRQRILRLAADASLHDSARHRKANLSVALLGSDTYAASLALHTARLLRGATRHLDRVSPEDLTLSLVSSTKSLTTPQALAASSLVQNALTQEGVSLQLGLSHVQLSPLGIDALDEAGKSVHIDAKLIIDARRAVPTIDGLSKVCDEQREGYEVDENAQLPNLDAVFAIGPCAIDEVAQPRCSNTPLSVVDQAKRLAHRLLPASSRSVAAVRRQLKLDALHLSLDRGALLVNGRAVGGLLGALAAQAPLLANSPNALWHLSSPLLAMGLAHSRSGGPFPSLLGR